jgi:hypothetical protein
MLRRILNTIGSLLMLSLASVAQAQYYPDVAYVTRPDGMQIILLRKVDGPDNYKYYLYSEPGIKGPGTCDRGLWNKTQSMWDMGIVLGKGSAKNIDSSNRAAVMWETDGSAWVVQLPTRDELDRLSAANQQPGANGIPPNWSVGCYNGGRKISLVEQGMEFWTSTWYWNDHYTYSLWGNITQGRWDTDQRAIALRTMKVDHDQVCLFEHGNYSGQYRCYGAGDYRWLEDMNDKVTGIISGKNCSARLYEHGDFGGFQRIYNERRKNAEPWYWLNGINDLASSMKVRCGDNSTVADSEVCLFEHGNMSGNVMCFGQGDFNHVAKFPDGNGAEDTFSSMVVGKNCSVTLYEHASYAGANASYSAKSTGKNLKVEWLDAMNDKTSSVKVSCS